MKWKIQFIKSDLRAFLYATPRAKAQLKWTIALHFEHLKINKVETSTSNKVFDFTYWSFYGFCVIYNFLQAHFWKLLKCNKTYESSCRFLKFSGFFLKLLQHLKRFSTLSFTASSFTLSVFPSEIHQIQIILASSIFLRFFQNINEK